jgi:putative MATE family efflux protein
MFNIKAYMRRQIIRLAWPVILEMSAIMMVGILVTAMVGNLGAVSLAAVGLATMVQISSSLVFAAAGTGAAAIVAREVGADNWPVVTKVTGQSLLLAASLGLILGLVGWVAAGPVFLLIGAELEVALLAASLLKIIAVFTPFYLIMAVGNAILRGAGYTRTAFIITSSVNTISLLVSYMLIHGIGFPSQGPYGAVWGTALSQLSGGVLVVGALAVNNKIKLRFGAVWQIDIETMTRIISISLPSALEQLAMQGGRIVFTFMLAGVSAVQFAAHQIAAQTETISFMPGFGFSVAAMTLTGMYLGKGLPHRAREIVLLTNKIAFCSMSIMGLVFILFSYQLTSLFINDPKVIYWGAMCVIVAALEQPTIAITYVFGGALRGSGDTRWPMIVTTIGVWLFRIPLVYLLIVYFHFSIVTAWFITAGDYLLRSCVLWWRFSVGKWQFIKV